MSVEKRIAKRCAVYTRKSSEEGLEQDFNSLDAQREACAAYVASQVGEGWRLVREDFEDGGFSGGTMERPGLQRLLAAIDRGEVDIIVVYKVDRLTRSLADFARIVERLEGKGASFVSVTQAFNTTTSMGRLTLNVLLSFAQFEREVTGERIRDKIAASKAKGLWMGGRPPIGYDPDGRTLAINEKEAELVRFIFRRYLELGAVHDLVAELAARNIRSKTWKTAKGQVVGGIAFRRGALFHLLRNRLYRGDIVHRDKVHPGQHAAIIDPDLFDRVQKQLDANVGAQRERSTRPGGSPLTGVLFDSAGYPMSPVHARGKSGKPHRYYVSQAILTGSAALAGAIARVPASPIEDLVQDRIKRLAPTTLWDWKGARALIKKIVIEAQSVEMTLRPIADAERLSERLAPRDRLDIEDDQIRLTIPIRLKVRGGASRLLDDTGRLAVEQPSPSAALIRAVAKAYAWRGQFANGERRVLTDVAEIEGVTESRVRARLVLAFLAPDLIRAILDGRQPPGLTLAETLRGDFPLDWRAQRARFGFSARG